MFKKKTNKISNENSSSDYKSSVTVPFTVSFEYENPQKMEKMRKEIETREKEDLNNPQNILSLLDKNKAKNLEKRLESPSYIKPEDDYNPYMPAVMSGKAKVNLANSMNVKLADPDSGEYIRPEFFTRNRDYVNIGKRSNFDVEMRRRFARN